MTTVVAAILERDRRILICRRRADQAHPLKWEFPGGKVEAGETAEDALRRELREELAIEAECGRELARYAFAYPGKSPILLIFFAVRAWTGEIKNLIFERIEWATPAQLREFDFLEGDAPFIDSYLPGIEKGTL